jgi:hypothetical protein
LLCPTMTVFLSSDKCETQPLASAYKCSFLSAGLFLVTGTAGPAAATEATLHPFHLCWSLAAGRNY